MWRIMFAILAGMTILTVAILGFRGTTSTLPPLQPFHDMTNQPRYNAQMRSELFADGRSQRPPVEHAVAWGRSTGTPDEEFVTDDAWLFGLERIPVPVDKQLVARGRRQYDTYCAVCHDRTGSGNGITTQYGMLNPSSYHTDRLREVPDGEIYQVITMGKGQMGSYADKIERRDRWAIVAYVRALQLAQQATLDEVPEAERSRLEMEAGGS